MNVLYYVGTGSNKFGGLEKFNICLFKALIKQKHEIVAVYRRPIVEGKFKAFLETHGIKYRWIYDDFTISNESKVTNAKRLAAIVGEEKPDLIHYNFGNLYDIAFTRFRNPFLRFKAIYTAHCHANLSGLYLRIVFRILSLFVRKILCVSDAINHEFIEHLKSSKSKKFYLGVPKNNFDKKNCRRKFRFSDDEIIIINIAYHDHIKGVDVLIKAVDYLKNSLGASNFRVIQIGGSPIKEVSADLNSLLASVDISGCFEMWGLRDDVDEILAASDIYCQTSRSEGIPLSMMEACMAQLPIVATNVGGVSEVAKNLENALLSKNEDYKSIAEDLYKLIRSSDMRLQMGTLGHRISTEDFEISKQAHSLCDIYMTL